MPSMTIRHQRGLARPGRPHDRDELTAGEVDTHVIQCGHGRLSAAVDLAESDGLRNSLRLDGDQFRDRRRVRGSFEHEGAFLGGHGPFRAGLLIRPRPGE